MRKTGKAEMSASDYCTMITDVRGNNTTYRHLCVSSQLEVGGGVGGTACMDCSPELFQQTAIDLWLLALSFVGRRRLISRRLGTVSAW